MKFLGARQILVLPREDINVVECSDESDLDVCNGVEHKDWTFSVFGQHETGGTGNFGTFGARHETLVGNSEGTDTWASKFALKNGWVFDSVTIENPTNSIGQPAGFVSGGTTFQFSVRLAFGLGRGQLSRQRAHLRAGRRAVQVSRGHDGWMTDERRRRVEVYQGI